MSPMQNIPLVSSKEPTPKYLYHLREKKLKMYIVYYNLADTFAVDAIIMKRFLINSVFQVKWLNCFKIVSRPCDAI